jgi:hypothetical protein
MLWTSIVVWIKKRDETLREFDATWNLRKFNINKYYDLVNLATLWNYNFSVFQTICNHSNNSSVRSSYAHFVRKLFCAFELQFSEHSSRWWDFHLALRVEWLVDLWILWVCWSIEPPKWSLDIVVCSHRAEISKTSKGDVSIASKKSNWIRCQYLSFQVAAI